MTKCDSTVPYVTVIQYLAYFVSVFAKLRKLKKHSTYMETFIHNYLKKPLIQF